MYINYICEGELSQMIEPNKKITKNSSVLINKKSTKNQVPLGIISLVFAILTGIFLSNISSKLSLYWITGISIGIILQKSRFCFAASMRDPYLAGVTSLSKAVLIAFGITTVGFAAIKYGAFINGLPIPGQDDINPINITTAVGAFMFGIGMVIAGGCATGTLMRVGEGFPLQLISLFFFIVGSLWGAHDYGWWYHSFIIKGKAIFLPDIFGWFGGVVIQLLFIALLYILADKWGSRKENI